MDFEDAQYYVSETGQFVSYEEFMRTRETWWQIKERRQSVEQLDTTLYIAKSGKVQIQSGKAPNNINFLV